MGALCNHHHPGATLIEHTLEQTTTVHGDILTDFHAPLIIIDQSYFVVTRCPTYLMGEKEVLVILLGQLVVF